MPSLNPFWQQPKLSDETKVGVVEYYSSSLSVTWDTQDTDDLSYHWLKPKSVFAFAPSNLHEGFAIYAEKRRAHFVLFAKTVAWLPDAI